jgi:hypothetical protein
VMQSGTGLGSSGLAFTWSCEGHGQVPDLGELKQYKE